MSDLNLIVNKTKDKIFEEALKPIAIQMMKPNPQAETHIKLLEMMLQEFAWLQDNVIDLWGTTTQFGTKNQ